MRFKNGRTGRISYHDQVGRRSGRGSAEQRATGRAELLTSFSCHMCIQYSTQELQDVSLYKTSSDIIEPVELLW